jgi:L-lactate dehydrogenase complex protein LldE
MIDRPSPKGKKVSLFVTCMVDMLYPDTGMSTVQVLEHLGCTVEFPMGQTCCGQPAFNSGYQEDARAVARQFLKAFAGAEVIVAPSGSCTAMIRHEYPTLFANEPEWRARAEKAAAITWELTEFVVAGLGVTDLHARLKSPHRVAFHDACHGKRLLGLGASARKLVGNIEGAKIEELAHSDECCGFGGLFSVKMADVSGAMLGEKINCIQGCSTSTILTGDVSCMTHMNGGLEKQKASKRVRHVVDFIAEALPERST